MIKFAQLVVTILFFFAVQIPAFPQINFGSQNAILKISSNAVFQIDSPNLIINGTLKADPNATIVGQSISFQNGVNDAPNAQAAVYFDATTEVALNGRTSLIDKWIFTGKEGVLNGKGNVLDLTPGGQLIVDGGTTLHLNNILIRGISGAQQSIVLSDNDSQIRASNVLFEVVDSFTITQGGIYIEGPTTFMLPNSCWVFDQNGSLTVDGMTLVLDSLGTGGFLLADEATRHLCLLNSGTIRMQSAVSSILNQSITVDTHVIQNITQELSMTNVLTSSPLVHNITLSKSEHINPDEMICINNTITIDGGGATVIFSNPNHPQFKVASGKTVRLTNIELARIHANTFDLATDSKIEIDHNVRFELTENLTFSQGSIVLTNTSNTFFVVGRSGKQQLTLHSTSPRVTNLIQLNSNTLALQDIELSGLKYISKNDLFINNEYVVGAIGLAGGASVYIESDSSMNFIVENIDNYLRLLNDNIILNGFLLFGDYLENSVHLLFAFPQLSSNGSTVKFGDNFAYVGSPYGRAGILFDDFVVNVNNIGSNSFVLSDGASLSGYNLNLLQFPIKKVSSSVNLSGGLVFSSNQPNAIDTSFVRSDFKASATRSRARTALHLLRQKERKGFIEEKEKPQHQGVNQNVNQVSPQQQSPSYTPKPRPSKPSGYGTPYNMYHGHKSPSIFNNIFPASYPQDQEVSKAGVISNQYDAIYYNNVQLSNASGSILVMNTGSTQVAVLDNFGIDAHIPLNLTLENGAAVHQGTNDIALKACDTITIAGAGSTNTIEVKKNCVIQGQLQFQPGSNLQFELNDSIGSPVVSFINQNGLTIPDGSQITFKGRGTVQLADGYVVSLGGKELGATLALQDGAVLEVVSGSPITIGGKGRIILCNGGSIDVLDGGHLIVGASPADEIAIDASLSGGIRVHQQVATRSTQASTLSFVQATFDFNFQKGALLYIGNNCICEINALNNNPNSNRGYIRSMFFESNGILNIDAGGKLVIGTNLSNSSGMQGGYEKTFPWSNLGGLISGTGLIQFAGTNFIGQLNPRFFANNQMTGEQLVSSLLQLVPNLKVSTVFYDSNGVRTLRTKNNVFVPLQDADVVVNDTVKGDVVIYNNELLSNVIINAYGARIKGVVSEN